MRQIHFVPEAWAQYTYWHKNYAKSDRKTLKRINLLIETAARETFEGIGKPEPLVGNLTGYWSRRIDEAHRLVYRATDEALIVVACRYHYGQ
jgi:toxin YoeB